MTRFSTLHPDGSETNVREIRQSDMVKCPHFIMVAEHYRDDGSCKCDDAEERVKMIDEWGLLRGGFREDSTS